MKRAELIRLAKCPTCSTGWVKPDPGGFQDWGVCDECGSDVDILVDLWSRVVEGEALAWAPSGSATLLWVVSA